MISIISILTTSQFTATGPKMISDVCFWLNVWHKHVNIHLFIVQSIFAYAVIRCSTWFSSLLIPVVIQVRFAELLEVDKTLEGVQVFLLFKFHLILFCWFRCIIFFWRITNGKAFHPPPHPQTHTHILQQRCNHEAPTVKYCIISFNSVNNS